MKRFSKCAGDLCPKWVTGVGRTPSNVLLLLIARLKHVQADRTVKYIRVLQGGADGDFGRIVGVLLREVQHKVEHCMDELMLTTYS